MHMKTELEYVDEFTFLGCIWQTIRRRRNGCKYEVANAAAVFRRLDSV